MQQGLHFQAPPLSKMNKYLIISLVAFFILNSLLGGGLAPYLALSLKVFKSGLIYQFITYPFIQGSFMSLLFESLVIWFIGSDLELKWGRKFYIEFFVFTSLAVAPLYIFLSYFLGAYAPLYGITGFSYGLLVAYAMIYSERQLTFMLLFPMKAKYFCLLLAGIQLYMGFFSGAKLASLCQLAAMGFSFLFLKYKSMKAQGNSFSSFKDKRHKEKMKSKLRIVTDDERKDKADPKDPRFWQ